MVEKREKKQTRIRLHYYSGNNHFHWMDHRRWIYRYDGLVQCGTRTVEFMDNVVIIDFCSGHLHTFRLCVIQSDEIQYEGARLSHSNAGHVNVSVTSALQREECEHDLSFDGCTIVPGLVDGPFWSVERGRHIVSGVFFFRHPPGWGGKKKGGRS